MSNCTSGCKTQDCPSYGACLRNNAPSVRVTVTSNEYATRSKWATELTEYRAARRQGIQPRSTQLKDIRSAVRRSRKLDRPVQES